MNINIYQYLRTFCDDRDAAGSAKIEVLHRYYFVHVTLK